MSVKPLRDFLAVEKEEGPKTSPGGIFIGHAAGPDDKQVVGPVVAVGEGHMTSSGTIVPLIVKDNDKVTFNKSLAVEVKDGEKTYYLVREDNIICILV